VVRTDFSADFFNFSQFLTPPPSNGNPNYLAHLKGQWLPKKRWKLYQNQPINCDRIVAQTMSPSRCCLFGLAVECATARLSTQTGLISWTEPGMNPARDAKIRSDAYAIGLISWAASEGLMVSSLICDRWLTRKLTMFMGSTNSVEC